MGDLSTSRRVVIGALALALTLVGRAAAADPGPQITCSSCYLIDDTGRALFARAAREPRPNASTTKMITALVVRDAVPGDEIVTVSANAAATIGGGLALEAGDRYSVDALLYALLMTSSNDAAVALAEHVSRDEATFVAAMNRLSDAMGATETRSVTAHGLDMLGHHSSARDLAVFATAVLADPVLARIVGTARTSIAGPEGRELIENRNVLLEGYRGATGVKTGYTAGSGDVLVASATRGERTLIAVAMDSEDAAADARRLLDHGWAALADMPLLRQGTPVATLVFDPAGATRVVAARGVRGPADPTSLEVTFEPDVSVAPPIDPGEAVGTVNVYSDTGALVGSVPAIAASAVRQTETSWAESFVAGVLRTAGAILGW